MGTFVKYFWGFTHCWNAARLGISTCFSPYNVQNMNLFAGLIHFVRGFPPWPPNVPHSVSFHLDLPPTDSSADAEGRRVAVAPPGLQHVHTPSPGGHIRFISALVWVLTPKPYRIPTKLLI